MTKQATTLDRGVLLCAMLLSGCDFSGYSTPLRKDAVIRMAYDKHCIGGVTYLKADRGVTVQLDRDGKVIPCDQSARP